MEIYNIVMVILHILEIIVLLALSRGLLTYLITPYSKVEEIAGGITILALVVGLVLLCGRIIIGLVSEIISLV